MAALGAVAQAEIARLIAGSPEPAGLPLALIAELVKRLYLQDTIDKADLRALVAVLREHGAVTRLADVSADLDQELED